MLKPALKIVLTSLIILYGLFITTPIHAQNSQATPSAHYQTNLPNDPRSPQFVNLYVINIIHTLSCLAEGVSVISQPCVSFVVQQTGKDRSEVVPFSTTQPLAGGAMGSIASFMTAMYSNPPVRTAEYIADWSINKDLIKPVYAQVTGSGSAVLSPIFNIWKLTQQIAFVGMIVIFLVVGFMIMFRTRINPQTVISAQAALPGLVIGIILIYFSYFLAGLIIDTTFVTTHLAGNLLEGKLLQPAVLQPGTTDKLLKEANILGIFNAFLKGPNIVEVATTTGQTLDFLNEGLVGRIVNFVSFVGGCYVGQAVAGSLPVISGIKEIPLTFLGTGVVIDPKQLIGCTGGGLGAALFSGTPLAAHAIGGLIGLIFYLVLIIALLIAMFKLLFSLVSAYITLIINTIAAPLIFLMGSLPGKQDSITNWFKTMFANALIFPAVFAALLFAAYILNFNQYPFNVASGPGDFSSGTVPLLAGLPSLFIKLVLAYGILLLTPTIPDMVRGAFGIKASPLGQAGLGAFIAGFGVGRAGATKGWGAATGPLSRQREAYQRALAEYEAGRPGTAAPIFPAGRHWFPRWFVGRR